MKTIAKPIKPRVAPPEVDTDVTFAFDGTTGAGLTPEQAKAKFDAFKAKHPVRTIRKGQKGTVELVKEARESRDRR